MNRPCVYLLKLLCDRGLQFPQLHIICQSPIVSRILYALPAWGGLLSAELKGRINAFLRCLYKYGFMHSIIDIEYLLTSSDQKLFRNMQKCEHCLNHLLPPREKTLLHFDPRVFSFCCLFAFMSCIGIPLLFAASHCLLCSFPISVMFVCHLIIKDYLLTYLSSSSPSSFYCRCSVAKRSRKQTA